MCRHDMPSRPRDNGASRNRRVQKSQQPEPVLPRCRLLGCPARLPGTYSPVYLSKVPDTGQGHNSVASIITCILSFLIKWANLNLELKKSVRIILDQYEPILHFLENLNRDSSTKFSVNPVTSLGGARTRVYRDSFHGVISGT